MTKASTITKRDLADLLNGHIIKAAAYAGVSRTTVSLYLRGQRKVSAATEAKILEFAESLAVEMAGAE